MITTGNPTEVEAIGFIHMKTDTVSKIKDNEQEKNIAIAKAEKSGMEAARNTSLLVPLLHDTELLSVDVRAFVFPNGIEVKSIIRSASQSGVEVEALTAVARLC
jgi:cyclic pyranopterin phosphate synthase